MVLLPAVARCDQFRLVSAKAFPAKKKAIHPQTLKLILTTAVRWCRYLPAGIHPVGIERAQNFMHLEKYYKKVKLSGGERYSESLLDNLNKAACVCRKYAVALCLADNQYCGKSGSSDVTLPCSINYPTYPQPIFGS